MKNILTHASWILLDFIGITLIFYAAKPTWEARSLAFLGLLIIAFSLVGWSFSKKDK